MLAAPIAPSSYHCEVKRDLPEAAMTTPPSWKTKNRSLFTVWSNGEDKQECTGTKSATVDKRIDKAYKGNEKDKPEAVSVRESRHGDNTSQLKEADRYIYESYKLVWDDDPLEYLKAIELLLKAMKIQRYCLGKHHPDVGWTANFIGTAHWRLSQSNVKNKDSDQKRQIDHCKSALQYFMEARRIFCKAGSPTDLKHPPVSVGQPHRVVAIDRRIQCILSAQMGWDLKKSTKFTCTLQQRIDCEVEGDWWKAKGDLARADTHYRKARQLTNTIEKHIG
jgi:hypothetical protein